MLNKSAKIVLKKLISTNFKYTNIEEFSKSIPKMSTDDVESSLCYLDEHGYIDCTYADSTVYTVSPTYEGQHFQQFVIAQIKEFLLKSVAVPIGVSVVTSIIVNIICKII